MVFSVSQTSHGFTADASGSTFAADFGAAVTGNTMTVRVAATKLLFVAQPTTTNVSTAMTPNPTVKACDANNNTDVDYSTAVSVTSTGTLTGSPVAGSWTSGVATFSGLTHTVTGTGLTLTATSTGITNATSNTFDINVSTSCATDLIISEYVEGSSSNKYIEIYNNTGASVNLTNYKLQLFANGASSPTNDVTLSGTLADNSTIVYKNNLATIYGGTTTVNSVCNFNGDDAVALYKISTSSYVDIFGRIGEDPGSAWTSGVFTTKAKTLVRNASVLGGVTTNPTSGFPTLSTEWTQYDIDDVSHLGAHTMSCSCTEPTTNSTGMSFTNLTNFSVDITIATPGNGSKRIIVAREGSAVSFTPTDNNTYEANSIFSDAIDLGAGNKVVYNETGTTATISGLNGNTTYYFKVYEYNCSEGSEDYYTGGTLLEGHTTTAVSPVTNLKVICQTNITAEII